MPLAKTPRQCSASHDVGGLGSQQTGILTCRGPCRSIFNPPAGPRRSPYICCGVFVEQSEVWCEKYRARWSDVLAREDCISFACTAPILFVCSQGRDVVSQQRFKIRTTVLLLSSGFATFRNSAILDRGLRSELGDKTPIRQPEHKNEEFLSVVARHR